MNTTTQEQHLQWLQLLAHYAERSIGQMLDHEQPPCNLADMTTDRLDSPDALEEVIRGVLAARGLQDQWQSWKYRLKQVREEARPCWIAGQSAYAQCRQDHRELDGQMLAERGMELARVAFDDNSLQMWCYEGWLAAMEAEGGEILSAIPPPSLPLAGQKETYQ